MSSESSVTIILPINQKDVKNYLAPKADRRFVFIRIGMYKKDV